MPNNLKHFAIHADDVDRARKFYQEVMEWRFTLLGPARLFSDQDGNR